jgi:hypothetical protein
MKAIVPVLLVMMAPTAASAAESRPVVVELFTSQGCSSCPPADRLLGELAHRKDIVALGFHVTYWNGFSWRDPLSRALSTSRQTAYDQHLTNGQNYTPQMVIEGTQDVVGSDRAAVLAALDAAKPAVLAPVVFGADRHSVAIGTGAGVPGTKVLLARYLLSSTTHVGGGENASRTLTDVNAVEALTVLGGWEGNAASFAIEPPGAGEGVAVLVQAPDGRMLGAAAISASG